MNTDEMNKQQLEFILGTLAPDYWKLFKYAEETQTNIDFMCMILRAMYKVKSGTGWGEVIVEIRNGKEMQVTNSERGRANEIT